MSNGGAKAHDDPVLDAGSEAERDLNRSPGPELTQERGLGPDENFLPIGRFESWSAGIAPRAGISVTASAKNRGDDHRAASPTAPRDDNRTVRPNERDRARTAELGMLSLTGLMFALVKDVEAADLSSQRPLLEFLDDDNIKPKDLQLSGTIDLVLRDGRHFTLDDPGQTIIINGGGSISVLTNSDARMMELQKFQQDALAAYSVGFSGPTTTGGSGSSTPPSLLLSPIGLQPITFIQEAPAAPIGSPNQPPATSTGTPATEPFFIKAALPSPPSLTAPAAVLNVDTAAFDTFKATSGSLVATDINGATLKYGILGGTVGLDVTLSGSAYDVSGASPYGTLYLNSSSGAYAFVPNSAAINALTTTTSENFVITVSNGSASTNQTLTITLDGANDAPTLAPVSGPTYIDTGQYDHFVAVNGVLHGSDVDLPPQTLTYGIVGGTVDLSNSGYDQSLVGLYGKLYISTATGSYTFVPNDAAINALNSPATEQFSFTVSDGALSATQVITVTINGANDAAVISGTGSGTVVEAGGVNNAIPGTPTASGTLTDTDVDNAANSFTAVLTATASDHRFGTFTMTAGGVWTYTLDNANATVQGLNAGQTLTDTFTVTTVDGTAQVITVTINGANDAAVISGTGSGTVVEAGGVNNAIPGTPTASGTLTDTDVDNAANSFTAVLTATASDHRFGTFTMTAGGVWTYTLDNANATVQGLNAGQTLTDTFTVTTVDGTAQVITVTINGANDGFIVAAGTTFKMNGDTLEQSSIDIEGTLQGYGKITGDDGTLTDIVDNGLIEASSSHSLYLNANITGTGTLELTNNTTMELVGTVASTLSVVFAVGAGATGKLILDDPADFQASISGFGGTDLIDLHGLSYSSTIKTILSSNNLTATIGHETISISIGLTQTIVTVNEGQTTATIKLEGNYTGHSFTFSSDGHGGTQFIDPLAIASGATLTLQNGSSDSVLFINDTGISGTLVLTNPAGYTGAIFGFTGTDPQTSDLIDLQGIAFSAGTSWTYTDNLGADTGGVLTIYETIGGVTTVVDKLAFGDGDFTTENFILVDDGQGGTLVIDPPSPNKGSTAQTLSASTPPPTKTVDTPPAGNGSVHPTSSHSTTIVGDTSVSPTVNASLVTEKQLVPTAKSTLEDAPGSTLAAFGNSHGFSVVQSAGGDNQPAISCGGEFSNNNSPESFRVHTTTGNEGFLFTVQFQAPSAQPMGVIGFEEVHSLLHWPS